MIRELAPKIGRRLGNFARWIRTTWSLPLAIVALIGTFIAALCIATILLPCFVAELAIDAIRKRC